MTVDFLAAFWRPADRAVTDMAMATVIRIISLRSREPVRITCRDSQVPFSLIFHFENISCSSLKKTLEVLPLEVSRGDFSWVGWRYPP